MFTTTDYGIRPSSSLQKPELHGLIKALLSTRWIITRLVIDFIFFYVFFFFVFVILLYFIVLYSIFTLYFTVSVQIVMCMLSFRAASFNKFELEFDIAFPATSEAYTIELGPIQVRPCILFGTRALTPKLCDGSTYATDLNVGSSVRSHTVNRA